MFINAWNDDAFKALSIKGLNHSISHFKGKRAKSNAIRMPHLNP